MNLNLDFEYPMVTYHAGFVFDEADGWITEIASETKARKVIIDVNYSDSLKSAAISATNTILWNQGESTELTVGVSSDRMRVNEIPMVIKYGHPLDREWMITFPQTGTETVKGFDSLTEAVVESLGFAKYLAEDEG